MSHQNRSYQSLTGRSSAGTLIHLETVEISGGHDAESVIHTGRV